MAKMTEALQKSCRESWRVWRFSKRGGLRSSRHLEDGDDYPTELLTEREEILLMRYCDGEGGFLLRWRAGRLVRSRVKAQEFLGDMQSCGDAVRRQAGGIERLLPASWSMVTEVQRGIDKQRWMRDVAARGIGSRRFSPEFLARLGWGMTGALTAASVLLVMSPRDQGEGRSREEVGKRDIHLDYHGGVPVSVQSVALDESRRARVSTPRRGVEWLRTAGRTQIIEIQGARVPVMWVSRAQRETRTGSRVVPLPTVSFAGGQGGGRGELSFRADR
jgi:hypothetical protein